MRNSSIGLSAAAPTTEMDDARRERMTHNATTLAEALIAALLP